MAPQPELIEQPEDGYCQDDWADLANTETFRQFGVTVRELTPADPLHPDYVTKMPVTKLPAADVTKMRGRPPRGDRAMTGAERTALWRKASAKG